MRLLQISRMFGKGVTYILSDDVSEETTRKLILDFVKESTGLDLSERKFSAINDGDFVILDEVGFTIAAEVHEATLIIEPASKSKGYQNVTN